MAYDIECDSAHGDFPVPVKDYIKLAREIYNNYMKINQLKLKLINENDKCNRTTISSYNTILENREDFAIKRIKAAFNKNGSDELEISEIFTKINQRSSSTEKFKPTKSQLKMASTRIAEYLTISNNTNSIERKKHSTRCINKINKILNESFPEVAGDQTIQIASSERIKK